VIFNTDKYSTASGAPVPPEGYVIPLKTSALFISSLSHDSVPVTTSGLYVSITFQNSKTLLQILLQFTYRMTSGLPSVAFFTVDAARIASDLFSGSLLIGFDVGPSLTVVSLPADTCAHVDVLPVFPDVPSLEILSAMQGHLLFAPCPPPPTSHFSSIAVPDASHPFG